MLPYILLLLFITILGLMLCEWKKSRRNDMIFLVIVSLVLFVMSVIRSEQVSTDYVTYLDYFYRVSQSDISFLWSSENIYRFEPGYSLLNYGIALFSHEQVVFASVIAFIMLGLTSVFVYNHSSYIWLSMFTFVSFGFYGYTLVTIRQQMAICIFMFAIPYLQKKKLLPYLLITVLAAMFHKSLWAAVPVYLFAWIPVNKKSLAIYGTGTAALLLFTDPILDFVTQFVFTGYTADSYFRMYGRDFPTAFIPMVLFLVVMFRKKALLERNPANLPLINLSAYSCIFFTLTLNTFLYQRIALIFLPVVILLLPELLSTYIVDDAKCLALDEMKKTGKKLSKQMTPKYLQLKSQLNEDRIFYKAAIGFILFSGWFYYAFLLNTNRLLLVPYLTIFS